MKTARPLGSATLRAKTQPVKQKNTSVPPPSAKRQKADGSPAKKPLPKGSVPGHLQMALIRLADLYEDAMDRSLDDATCVLHGLRDLIAYHPELREYHRALDGIVEGEDFLNKSLSFTTRSKVLRQPANQDAAAMAVGHAYEMAMGTQYEDAVNDLCGVRDLIAHNLKLREYHQAITRIVEGHQVLMRMYHQVREL